MLPPSPRRTASRACAFILLALSAAACGESTKPAPPTATSIEVVAGAPATSTAGAALTTAPSFVVKDQNGGTMAGVPVTVTASTGGAVSGAPAVTATTDPTPIGTWTLAPVAGTNTLTIAVAGIAAAVITVQGVAGPTAKLAAQTGLVASGTVGEGSFLLPRVRVTDAFDNPVAGALVAVTVTGGGSSPASVTADAQGIAEVASWTLGTTAGVNTLTMTAGAVSRTFTVNAAAGPATSLAIVGGNAQSGPAGGLLAQPVVFSAADRYGNPVTGSGMSFTLDGDGEISDYTTDAQGRTSVAWRLGKSAVAQSLRAESGAFSATATATVQSSYDVEVRFVGTPMSPSHRAAFVAAAARVRAMVTGDVEDATTGGALDLATACGNADYPTVNEVVDDLVIYASAKSIDGPGQLLGRAGPCIIRGSGSELPVYGIMEFDADDLDRMESEGTLESVILHEMLHVVGIGTYWEYRGLLQDKDLATVAFTGAQARQQCLAEGGTLICGTAVPVESTGGAGTQNSHWRETVFDTELMTGWENAQLESGRALPLPLSRMTVGSLADIGYAVNYDAADDYRVPAMSLVRGARRPARQLREAQTVLPRFRLGRDGRLAPLTVVR